VDPPAAAKLAADVVANERAHRVLEPALVILAEAVWPHARGALRERFSDLTDNGMRYDQDCSLRIGIVRALRAIGSSEDLDVAERGVRTIQRNPPARVDVAQALRGQCLLFLGEIDPARVEYFAVELLNDPHLSSFSGEPAVTAIQVLAARGQILPIWALARRPGPQADVLAQAFASLRGAPRDLQLDALLGHLIEAIDRGEDGEPVALVAAEAIVLNRLAGGYPTVAKLLRQSPNLNLVLYLAGTAARQDDPLLCALLIAARDAETNPQKTAILREALGRVPHR
jgi:hypothetical protein